MSEVPARRARFGLRVPEPAKQLKALVLFDLDGTLTHKDTEDEWAKLLGERGLIDPAPQAEFNAAYHRGELDLDAYFEWYGTVLRAHPLSVYRPLRDELVMRRMLPSIPPVARTWIAEARAEAGVMLLVTASNHFLTQPIGEALGFTDVLATKYEQKKGRFTGERSGPPCFREGKLEHVENWLKGEGYNFERAGRTTFFSDSHNDLPLLEAVHRPIAVDPDPILTREVLNRGWERRTLGDRV